MQTADICFHGTGFHWSSKTRLKTIKWFVSKQLSTSPNSPDEVMGGETVSVWKLFLGTCWRAPNGKNREWTVSHLKTITSFTELLWVLQCCCLDVKTSVCCKQRLFLWVLACYLLRKKLQLWPLKAHLEKLNCEVFFHINIKTVFSLSQDYRLLPPVLDIRVHDNSRFRTHSQCKHLEYSMCSFRHKYDLSDNIWSNLCQKLMSTQDWSIHNWGFHFDRSAKNGKEWPDF